MTNTACSTPTMVLQMKQKVKWKPLRFHLTDFLWARLKRERPLHGRRASIIGLRPSGPQGETVHYTAAWQRQAPPNETARAELY